jgi:acetylornithine deacetylase/succinyl-diaminopimelate desuccinylase-like protein
MTSHAALIDGLDFAGLHAALARRIAIRTESQLPERAPELRRYLQDEMAPSFAQLGFDTQLWENPVAGAPPFLFASRFEDAALPTVLMYGHGDVVAGDETRWRKAASPWALEIKDRRWYGRGSADNKGQHSINLHALGHLLQRRGRLGFNVKWLMCSSPPMARACAPRCRPCSWARAAH